jgi:hypothetical protein
VKLACQQAEVDGLTAAMAWTIEAVGLHAAMTGGPRYCPRLAGHARAVHPSVATRAGARKAVVERLDALLTAGLSPDVLPLALAEGGRWSARTAADRALFVVRG